MYSQFGRLRAIQLVTATALCGALSSIASPAYAQSSASQSSSSDEIVITAQRRAERLVDVPITVTAVSGQALENSGVTATSQLAQVVPAYRVDYSGTYFQPSIRGVNTAVSSVGAGAAVGIYVDGYLVTHPLSADFSFLNVQNIQVLKGPQGTLFGRNTTGGAVLITSSDPTHDPTLRVTASLGNYNERDFGLYASTGFGDHVALDIALQYSNGDGYVTHLVTHQDDIADHETSAIRVGALFDISPHASLLLRYSHVSNDDPMSFVYGALNNQTIGLTIGGGAPYVWGSRRGETAVDPRSTQAQTNVDQFTMTANVDFGWAKLTSRSMVRDQGDGDNALDLDSSSFPGLSVDIPLADKAYTQEFLLAHAGDRWDWVTGAFWMQDTIVQTLQFLELFGTVFPKPVYDWTAGTRITALAAFGDVTFKATDHLYLTAGARWSREENSGFWVQALPCTNTTPASASIPNAVLGCGSPYHQSKVWEDVSPRVVARYEFGNGSSAYASYSQGFKSGIIDFNGFNPDPIRPEGLDAYEIGYKYAGNGTRIEVSAFHYDYTDLQSSSYIGTQSVTTNAASTTVDGAELSFSHDLTSKLTVSGGVAYTHGVYDSFPSAPFFHGTGGGTFDFFPPQNAAGKQMERSAEWSGNLALDYQTPLAGGVLELYGNWYATSETFFDPANQFSQPAYDLLSLRASWAAPGDHWKFAVFGNNVTDEVYLNQVLTGIAAAQTTYGAPATYGVSIAYNY